MSDVNSVSGTASEDRRRWVILGVIGIAQLMVVLDLTIMNIALPSAPRADPVPSAAAMANTSLTGEGSALTRAGAICDG